jgi:hypothetical protein
MRSAPLVAVFRLAATDRSSQLPTSWPSHVRTRGRSSGIFCPANYHPATPSTQPAGLGRWESTMLLRFPEWRAGQPGLFGRLPALASPPTSAIGNGTRTNNSCPPTTSELVIDLGLSLVFVSHGGSKRFSPELYRVRRAAASCSQVSTKRGILLSRLISVFCWGRYSGLSDRSRRLCSKGLCVLPISVRSALIVIDDARQSWSFCFGIAIRNTPSCELAKEHCEPIFLGTRSG